MAERDDQETYVLKLDAVHRAIAALSARPIHEHLPGYLAILRALRKNGAAIASMSDITDFHDRYLKAPGHPEASPFIRPFKSRGRGLEAFNANVAGSYAPSSVRAKGRLTEVLAIEGSHRTATYGLLEGHAEAALGSLLQGEAVPAVALAVFLYRDYGLRMDAPSMDEVLNVFRDEFGLREDVPEEDETFEALFTNDRSKFTDDDLEPLRNARTGAVG